MVCAGLVDGSEVGAKMNGFRLVDGSGVGMEWSVLRLVEVNLVDA